MTEVSSPPEYASTTFLTPWLLFTLHPPQHEILHQRFLRVQPVLGLVPNDALRPVHHLPQHLPPRRGAPGGSGGRARRAWPASSSWRPPASPRTPASARRPRPRSPCSSRR